MAILRAADLHITNDKLRPLPSPRHQRRYEIIAPDGTRLELVLAPSHMARLLRSEQSMVNSEAVVVRWIHQLVFHEKSHGQETASVVGNVTSPSGTSHDDDEHLNSDPGLSVLLPKLVHHCPASRDPDSPSSVFQRSYGTAITSLSLGLTDKELRHVDFQQGRLTRRLSKIKSPSGLFGPAAVVLTPNHAPPKHFGDPLDKSRTSGDRTWSAAFHSMLEGILRDGEDMSVTISYSTIRQHFRRLSHLLNSVETARLVVVDAAEHSNVLVARMKVTSDDVQRNRHHAAFRGASSEEDLRVGGNSSSVSGSSEDDAVDSEDEEEDDNDHDNDSSYVDDEAPCCSPKIAGDTGKTDGRLREGDDTGLGTKKDGIRVTGLRDWSNCIFGDPLFARAFSDDPSDAFLQGFYGSEHSTNTTESPISPHESDGPVEDEHNARYRLLLYQTYHATEAIVKEFYGQRTDKSRMELAARKRLGEILAKLEDIDVEPKRMHRRPSGEMSPAKKLRQSPDGGR